MPNSPQMLLWQLIIDGLQLQLWLRTELINVTVSAPGGSSRELMNHRDRLQLQCQRWKYLTTVTELGPF